MASEFDQDAAKHEMHVEEYRRLSSELVRRYEWAGSTERYGIIAIAAIYTWLLSRTTQLPFGSAIVGHAQWIPVFVSLVVTVRIRDLIVRSRLIENYLHQIEGSYFEGGSGPAVSGWQHYYNVVKSPHRDTWHGRAAISRTWCVILATTITIGVLSELPNLLALTRNTK